MTQQPAEISFHVYDEKLGKTNIAFPSRERSCDYIALATENNGSFMLKHEDVANDAGGAFIELYSSLSLRTTESECGEEYFLNMNDGLELRIGQGGSHIRLTNNGKEAIYWDVDEFNEEPLIVMGALAGSMICVECLNG